jgi:hypothetical protein
MICESEEIESEYLEYGGLAREIIHKSFCVRIEIFSRRAVHDQILEMQSGPSEMTMMPQCKAIFLLVFCLEQISVSLFYFPVMTLMALPGWVAMRRPRIAVISALIGKSERTAKAHSRQTLDADYYVFTDNPELRNNGQWIFDHSKYHLEIPSPIDNITFVNSLSRNHHPYMIYKYYKMQFHRIPRLLPYEVILWIDLDKTFSDSDCLERLTEIFRLYPSKNVIARSHSVSRRCSVAEEVRVSVIDRRWSRTLLHGERQPFQDVRRQYQHYLTEGFRENYWQREDLTYRNNKCIGLWQTNFLAYRMGAAVHRFLDAWYFETLKWTTQCQVSAAYVFQKLREAPYTLPDATRPYFPHLIVHGHGR